MRQIRVFGKCGSYLIVIMYSDEDYDVLGLSRHYVETGEDLGNSSVKLLYCNLGIPEPIKKSQKLSSKQNLK